MFGSIYLYQVCEHRHTEKMRDSGESETSSVDIDGYGRGRLGYIRVETRKREQSRVWLPSFDKCVMDQGLPGRVPPLD